MDNILIATIKEWNIANYFLIKEQYKDVYNFHLISSKEELSLEEIKKIEPKYIFFPHWSWIIPKDIYTNFSCIVFHMTDLPYGRGGSPMQNLIENGIYDTKVSALKVDKGVDTGDIYIKECFDISAGSAQENFIKLSNIIFEKMIPRLLSEDIIAKKQLGDVVTFQRRKPEDSNLKLLTECSLHKLYDFIRMLDADGYPAAFLNVGNLKIEFSEVHRKNKKLVGRFEVLEDE